MKRFGILVLLVGLLASVAGCNAITPAQATSLQQTATSLQQTSADLHTLATQPAPAQVQAAAGKASATTGTAATVVQGAATAVTQPGASIVDTFFGAISAATPYLPPPWSSYIGLAGIIYGLWKNSQVKTVTAASASKDAAFTTAVQAGKITVAPGATAIVDAVTDDHPSTVAFTQAVTHAGGGTLPPS